MTRLLPLIPVILWLTHVEQRVSATPWPGWGPAAYMLAGIVVIWFVTALLARRLIRNGPVSQLSRVARFQRFLLIARLTMVGWFGYVLFGLDYGAWVDGVLSPLVPPTIRVPGLLLATAPILVGWLALWVVSFPIDRASRELNVLAQIDDGLPVHAPPSAWEYVSNNLRLQVLFTVMPVVVVVAMRDLLVMGLAAIGYTMSPLLETLFFGVAVLFVLIISPALLAWVLRARRLPEGPLRRRLEELSRRLGIRCRDILLWRTDHSMGNAAVMGIMPQFRYILLTDLLVETLTPSQVDAVFAHEAGHVRHRHMLWYLLLFGILLMTTYGPIMTLLRMLGQFDMAVTIAGEMAVYLTLLVGFFFVFGALSRLFERQADVYAARTMELLTVGSGRQLQPLLVAVGPSGASVVAGALRRVAEINNIPLDRPRPRLWIQAPLTALFEAASNFQHPRMIDRIDHVQQTALDPQLTARFDRRVVAVMLGLLSLATLLTAWVGVNVLRTV